MHGVYRGEMGHSLDGTGSSRESGGVKVENMKKKNETPKWYDGKNPMKW